MKTLFRIAVTFLTLVSTFYFVFWLPFSLLPADRASWIPAVVSLLCAIGAAWFVWSKTGSAGDAAGRRPGSMASHAVLGAVVVGALGFTAGFFGPILFTPEANQGPLLGIFVTGPAGVVIGAIGGVIYSLCRRPRRARSRLH